MLRFTRCKVNRKQGIEVRLTYRKTGKSKAEVMYDEFYLNKKNNHRKVKYIS